MLCTVRVLHEATLCAAWVLHLWTNDLLQHCHCGAPASNTSKRACNRVCVCCPGDEACMCFESVAVLSPANTEVGHGHSRHLLPRQVATALSEAATARQMSE